MAFITLGTSTQLQIKVPTVGSTDWASTLQTDTFLKIAEHNHTGSGNGEQLGTGALLASAVTGAKIRLDNDEYLRSRNAADSADVNLLKLDTNDKVFIDPDLSKLGVINDTFITGRNNADSADINVIKVNASDELEIPTNIVSVTATSSTVDTVNNSSLVVKDSIALADNQVAAASVGVTTLSANQAIKIEYKINRNGDVETGSLEYSDVDTLPIQEFSGIASGVTFSVNAGDLEYVSTSTGFAPTLEYFEVRK
jgi:hypothetical protein